MAFSHESFRIPRLRFGVGGDDDVSRDELDVVVARGTNLERVAIEELEKRLKGIPPIVIVEDDGLLATVARPPDDIGILGFRQLVHRATSSRFSPGTTRFPRTRDPPEH